MFRKSFFISLLMIAAALLSLASWVPAVRAEGPAPSITFVGVFPVPSSRKWVYRVQSGTQPAIGHIAFNLGVPQNDLVAAGPGEIEWERGILKFETGFQDGEARDIWFILKSEWRQGATTGTIRSGTSTLTFEAPGPDPSQTPEAVTLAGFSVSPGQGGVLVVWETASEVNNLGFNLYRSEGDSVEAATKINGALIPTQCPGSIAGASYSYVDGSARPGVSYHYWLEDVEVIGRSTTPTYLMGLHDLGRGQWNMPQALSVSPRSGGQVYNKTRKFTATFRDRDADLASVYLLISDNAEPSGGVALRYDRRSGQFSLHSERYAFLQRAGCRVQVSEEGQKLTVTWEVKFRASFRGTHNLYLRAEDAAGNATEWRRIGQWSVQ